MTTYAQFQEYYTRKMWRVGDIDWTTDLPQLIRKAERKISRDLRNQDLMSSGEVQVTDNNFPLPSDLREFTSIRLVGDRYPQGQFVSQAEYQKIQGSAGAAIGYTTYFKGRYFCQIGNTVFFTGFVDANAPDTVKFSYYMGVMPYESDPPEPFYDKHPDFYEAALNVQAYEYLKDFELSGQYENSYQILLDDMRRESEYQNFPSGQVDSRPPGNVA